MMLAVISELEKNMFNYGWVRVKINKYHFERSSSILLPSLCVCCLKQPEEKLELSSTQVDQKWMGGYIKQKETTYNMNFPICKECYKHTKSKNRRAFFFCLLYLFAISFLSLLLSLIILGPDKDPGDFVSFSLLIFFIPSWMVYKRYNLKWWPKKHPPHTSKIHPVVMYKSRSDDIIIKFSNKEYAELFMLANKNIISSTSDQESLIDNRGQQQIDTFSGKNELPCKHCKHFDSSTAVCRYFHFNVKSYPNKYTKKCNGKFYSEL
jgi:hypothetical protein